MYQPWVGEVTNLMLAAGELAEAEEAGVVGFCDWAERHTRFLKEGPAKVIPLLPRKEE